MPPKIYVDGIIFMPFNIYGRHLSLPVRKNMPYSQSSDYRRKKSSFQTKSFKCSSSKKIHITESNFGKYLEPFFMD